MGDPRFERSVIYMCAHSSEGAMGIIVNRPAGSIDFPGLLVQLRHHREGRPDQAAGKRRDHEGVEGRPGRYRPRLRAAFQRFLHPGRDAEHRRRHLPDRDRRHPRKAIAKGSGPKHAILALGYAGWAPGQLEDEIQHNGWLHCDADADLIFGDDVDEKYASAPCARSASISARLSNEAGHA